jgi:hypothetical protein
VWVIVEPLTKGSAEPTTAIPTLSETQLGKNWSKAFPSLARVIAKSNSLIHREKSTTEQGQAIFSRCLEAQSSQPEQARKKKDCGNFIQALPREDLHI